MTLRPSRQLQSVSCSAIYLGHISVLQRAPFCSSAFMHMYVFQPVALCILNSYGPQRPPGYNVGHVGVPTQGTHQGIYLLFVQQYLYLVYTIPCGCHLPHLVCYSWYIVSPSAHAIPVLNAYMQPSVVSMFLSSVSS